MNMMDENTVLTRMLGKVQTRMTHLLSEKNSELERLNAQLMQLRAQSICKDSRIAFLLEDLAGLKASNPGLEAGHCLQKKVDQMAARQCELQAQNEALRQQLAAASQSPAALSSPAGACGGTGVADRAAPQLWPVALSMQQKTVLCIEAASASMAHARELVGRVGSSLVHHDADLDDPPNRLDARLSAADLVICQTGCLSHKAYWLVKNFCKRTGKQCVFVDNASPSALVQGLVPIAKPQMDAKAGHSAKALPNG